MEMMSNLVAAFPVQFTGEIRHYRGHRCVAAHIGQSNAPAGSRELNDLLELLLNNPESRLIRIGVCFALPMVLKNSGPMP